MSLPTPIKKSITSAAPRALPPPPPKVLNTPLKKTILTFDQSGLRKRTIGTTVAVIDSFKAQVPSKKLPSPLRNAITVGRNANANAMYSKPKKVLQTPVKKAITALRRRSLGLKKVRMDKHEECTASGTVTKRCRTA
jgi:hypothetical protein